MQKTSFLAVIAGVLFFISCNKNHDPAPAVPVTYLLSVYLSDNPTRLEEVNIDIHSVEIKIDTTHEADEAQIALLDTPANNDSLGAPGVTLWHGGIPAGNHNQFGRWVTLGFQPGTYDILQLRNGLDMLLGAVPISGTVRKIRIALGDGSYVKTNGTSFPLTLLDDSTNRHVYIDVLQESRVINSDGSMAVYLDFDLGRSVKYNGDAYRLFPYIRTLPADRSLEIDGHAFPKEASVAVSVYNNEDTATAIPDNSGYFKIRGLSLGRYSVRYHGTENYNDTTTVFDINQNSITLPPMTLREK